MRGGSILVRNGGSLTTSNVHITDSRCHSTEVARGGAISAEERNGLYEMLTQPAAHPGHIQSVASSPDTRLIATCGHDGELKVWDSATLSLLAVSAAQNRSDTVPCSVAAFTADSARIVGSVNNILYVWNASSLAVLQKVRPLIWPVDGLDLVYEMKLSADGTMAVFRSDHYGRHFQVWRVHSNDTLERWGCASNVHTSQSVGTSYGTDILSDYIKSIAINHDGSLIVTAHSMGTILVWDGLTPHVYNASEWAYIWFQPHMHRGIMENSSHWRNTITGNTQHGDPAVASRLNLLLETPHAVGSFSVAFSSKGHIASIAGGPMKIQIWAISRPPNEAATLELVMERIHRIALCTVLAGDISRTCGSIIALAFSSNGDMLATGGSDGSLAVWDLSDPRDDKRDSNPC